MTVRVRDDDVLVPSSSHSDPIARFKEANHVIVKKGAIHVPAILITEIQQFPKVLPFIRQETWAGRMEPQWHGWEHVDYAKIPRKQIEREIQDSQKLFMEWFGVEFTKFYTPWGANAQHIQDACNACGIEMVDCSNLIKCQHVIQDYQAYVNRDIEILWHWWEGMGRLRSALNVLKLEDTGRGFHDFIFEHLPKGKTILELGSGDGSMRLVEAGYTVYSVEHNDAWMNRHKSVNYIHAPLKEHKQVKGFGKVIWYDPSYLKDLPEYDLLIVDGPPGCEGRAGFLKYKELFNLDVPIVFDDLQRIDECRLVQKFAARLKRPFYASTIHGSSVYGVIMPDGWTWVPRKIQ
jgi:hypothetical protein